MCNILLFTTGDIISIQLYTAKEVSEILKIGYRKALTLLANGDIVAHQVGGEYRVLHEDLLEYLKQGRVDDNRRATT